MDEHTLRSKCGKASLQVMRCPTCEDLTLPSSAVGHPTFLWCVILECSECKTTWFCCRECSSKSTHITTQQTLRRHHNDKHRNDPIPAPALSQPLIAPAIPPARQTASGMYTDFDYSFSRVESYNYFRQQHISKNGLDYLVYKALSDGKNLGAKRIPEAHLGMIVRLVKLCGGISRAQVQLVAESLSLLQLLTEQDMGIDSLERKPTRNKPKDKNHVRVSIPKTPQSLRTRLLDGADSFSRNLPHPEVIRDAEHARLSLTDIVRDFLAKGGVPAKLSSHSRQIVSHASHSPRAAEISQSVLQFPSPSPTPSPRLIIGIMDWGDGATVTNAQKGSDSVYCKTVTILSPEDQAGREDMMNTYTLSISLAGSDNKGPDREFARELKSLRETPIRCYNAQTGKASYVNVGLVCSLADQPEKRKETGLLAGNSKYHARWGYSYNWNLKKDVLVACEDCLHHMVQADCLSHYECRDCNVCANWASNEGHPLLTYATPTDFPESEIREDTFTLRKLRFADLKECGNKAFDKLVSGEWTRKNAVAYLNWCCFNTEEQELLITRAANQCLKHLLDRAPGSLTEEETITVAALRGDMEVRPEKYERWKHNPTWDKLLEVEHYVDAPMHVIFLGVVKIVTFLFVTWATMERKYTSMVAVLSQMSTHLEGTNVSWCKGSPYKAGKLGGWVSENYMAFCRLMPWYYSCIGELTEEPPYVEPTEHYTNWFAKDLKEYLVAVGEDSTGNKSDLLERVKKLKERPEGPPPVLPPAGCSAEKMTLMLLAMFHMVKYIMSCTHAGAVQCSQVGRLVRIFLSRYAAVDKHVRDAKSKRGYITHFNLLCLLNLPRQMETVGPVKNQWEGGPHGEKEFRTVKPLLATGLRGLWERNTLTKIVKEQAQAHVFHDNRVDMPETPDSSSDASDSVGSDIDLVEEPDPREEAAFGSIRQVVAYRGIQQVCDRIQQRKVVSVIAVTCGATTKELCCGTPGCVGDHLVHHAVVLRGRKNICLHRVSVDGPEVEEFSGLNYYRFNPPKNKESCSVTRSEYELLVKIGALMLPRWTVSGPQIEPGVYKFAVIYENWQTG